MTHPGKATLSIHYTPRDAHVSHRSESYLGDQACLELRTAI